MRKLFSGKYWGILVGSFGLLFFFLGFLSFSSANPSESFFFGPEFSSGWQDKTFFDRAYKNSSKEADKNDRPVSAVVSHHLLVASNIASVFEIFRKSPPSTIVLISPNHFSTGISAMQMSFGQWETPYGEVKTNHEVAQALLEAIPELKNEERTFVKEHGIAAITPFFARSLPQTTIVAIVLDESANPEALQRLGEAIAALPDVALMASVDMAHYRGREETAVIDAAVLKRLETNGTCGDLACTTPLEIDSNASLAVLAAFNLARGATLFHLLSHTSSLELGATNDPEENTSHLQGYYSFP